MASLRADDAREIESLAVASRGDVGADAGLGLGASGVPDHYRPWALVGVYVGFAGVLTFTLVALARTVTARTGWYVIPYLLVTCIGAAYTALYGIMAIQDAWL